MKRRGRRENVPCAVIGVVSGVVAAVDDDGNDLAAIHRHLNKIDVRVRTAGANTMNADTITGGIRDAV